MKFGPVEIANSEGGIVAHAVRRDGIVLRKGDIIRAADIDALHKSGVETIVIARLEPGDVGEDDAAKRIADAVAGANIRVEAPFTGRANLFSDADGILLVEPDSIDRINEIDERITLATLPPFRTVVEGEMIATVKIIPFAVQAVLADRAADRGRQAPIHVKPFQSLRIGVISTLLPGLKPTTISKTLRVLEQRLEPARAHVVAELRIQHDAEPLAAAIRETAAKCDLLIVYGASAITDRRDVVPAALESAGGVIDHFGMPVDPGNLLLVGHVRDGERNVSVLGAPGCARSPKENGFDWVLHRLLAGIEVRAADIRRMGTGGLLMEIVSRGQPRGGEPAQVDD